VTGVSVLLKVLIARCECLIDPLIHILLLYALLNVLCTPRAAHCMRLPRLGRVNCVLGGCEDELSELDEARSLGFLELEHHPDDLEDVIRVALLHLSETRVDQLLPVVYLVLLVEAGHVFH